MNACSKSPVQIGFVRYDLTPDEIAVIETEVATLPWQWNVWTVTDGSGTADDPMQTHLDIAPADAEGIPGWLPTFTIRRVAEGYSITVYEDVRSEVVADGTETIDVKIEVCPTAAEAYWHVPGWLAATLQEWGLERIINDLPSL